MHSHNWIESAESEAQLFSLTGLTSESNHKKIEAGARGPGAGETLSDPWPLTPAPKNLFHFDGRAGVGELLLDGLGFVLADAFLDGLGAPSTRSLASFKPGW